MKKKLKKEIDEYLAEEVPRLVQIALTEEKVKSIERQMKEDILKNNLNDLHITVSDDLNKNHWWPTKVLLGL